ncbi:hypothetical protein DMN77_01305 [Paenibacillus sp. 79R4]|uniref:collagen binding domain-containing protein n=1 Tax=Paenibacillus sp. 79R4 TaxID=2212847 RepID=UPI0015B8FAAB|nr:collagen binding domain-containing protein [Paenibacillus sp. 79R4]NWL86233.1 hypothetical protein [Paenibacillus sp. 79R4]
MKKFKRPLFLFLAMILLLNIVLPSSITRAEGETEDVIVNQESVTDDVYGKTALLGTGVEITENLITGVKIYNQQPLIENDGSITVQGEEIQNIRPKPSDEVAIIYDWSLPDDRHAYDDGSTYSFYLPEEFAIPYELKGDLTGGVGKYVVSENKQVTFTFNDQIRGQQLHGQFFVWLSFDQSKLGESLQHKIDFSSVGQQDITVNFANSAINMLKKSGVANKHNFNSDEIEWTIEFNQAEKEIKDAKLTDNPGDGLEIKGNITITEMEVLLNGDLKPTNHVRTETAFPIDLGDINKAYKVTYKTSVKAPTEGNFKNREFKNTATLTGDNGYSEGMPSSVYISFNEPLNKKVGKAESKDLPSGGSLWIVDWSIEYNYNQQKISQPILEDSFGPSNGVHFKLANDKVNVYKVNIDSNGSATRDALINASECDLVILKDASGFETGFTLEFHNEITEAYVIEYQTEITERIYSGQDVNNSVTFGTLTKSDHKWLNERIFKKNVIREDFNKKEIEWQLILNEDKFEMAEVKIQDDYAGRHMKLLQDSIRVDGQKLAVSAFELEPGNYSEGFTLKLKSGETIKDPVIITYATSFDPKAGKPAEGLYKNKATMTWKDLNGQKSLVKEAYVKPEDYTNNNGRKTGEYSAKDKAITWTIIANYNLFDVKDAIITDALKGDQMYIDNSFEVHKLTLNPANNQISLGDPVTNYELKLADDRKSFELKLGGIGEVAYQIKYKTSLDGDFNIIGEYSNHAVLFDGTRELFSQDGKVTPKHGGELLYKTGAQVGKTDRAQWTVTLNPSQSYIPAGSELTDTLSDNQILLVDSLKLYEAALPANNSGNIPKGAQLNKDGNNDNDFFKLQAEGNSITLTFKKELRTTFILEYESFINADSGQRIKNKAEFSGKTASVIGEGNVEGIKVSLAGAGGGASTGTGKLKVLKLDDLNHPIKEVVFELWNASGTTLLETLTTNENGQAETSRNYRLNSTDGLPYILKEVSTPSGYIKDTEYAAGKTIYFKDSDEPFTVINEIIRQGFELTKVDQADPGKTLKGAKFVLNQITSTFPNGTPIDVLETDDSGKIAKGDLEPGKYQLIETKAPEFYELDSTPVTFDIVENQTSIKILEKTNEWGSNGKLIVTKVNAKDQSAIEGVEFELRDSSDALVGQGVTNENGLLVFENLKYGSYTLIETKADGFVIEQAETAVSIIQPETTQTIENKENDRSVKLTKYDSGKNLKLQGAVFELWEQSILFDPEGNYLYQKVADIDESKLITDKNGELLLEDLKPNKYQFIEVKAPAGYLLDKTPVPFEITDKQIETVFLEKTNQRIPSTGGGNGGGGGGGNPPVNPNPEPSVDPDKEVDPGETPDPTEPEGPKPGTEEPKPEPEKTTKPTDKVPATNKTPIKGKIEVPKNSTPKISEKPKNGKVTVDAKGNWVYTPDKGYTGPDSFKIKVADALGNEVEYAVDVDVLPSADGASTKGNSGKMLPKTGESSLLPIQLTGLALIALGVVLYFLRKRQLQHK